jgi:hypothetical protein|tara:strand:- start:182 stop:577 length:396 start_codon:yes stop_codon:yes gene_type:complete
MQLLGFSLFLMISHWGLMQVFRLTTYHVYFWKALPLLLCYSAGIAWLLFFLNMHSFFLWQFVLASVWLFALGRKQRKTAEAMLAVSGDSADFVRLMAASSAKTSSHYTYSSIIYIVVFAVVYTWLYNNSFA